MNQEMYYLIKDMEAAALATGHTFRMCRIGADNSAVQDVITELHKPYEKLAQLVDQLVAMADKAEVAA